MASSTLIEAQRLVDLPSLQQLSRSLWCDAASPNGAAVLIGAGFSRNAERASEDIPKPPLWSDLSLALAKQLYPDRPSDAPTDPLRLAEEYRAYFGQAAMSSFIRAHIHDSAWYPGKAHHALLELPWADVLTTNWDTLLEKAAKRVSSRDYQTVRFSSDLVQARTPRIVKLHGTVGSNDQYVFAEEDYRQYPQKHAAFVNLARQVFIENELCLLGFSGDDPNFLQWSGWVRDQLAGTSRRMYLVGVLRLSPAKRRLLEARNVSPIDLTPVVEHLPKELQHERATDWFLEFLRLTKPRQAYEWKPTRLADAIPEINTHGSIADADAAAGILVKATAVLAADRSSFPGWLVCPHSLRSELRWSHVSLVHQFSRGESKLTLPQLGALVYELAWRHDTALQPHDEGELSRMAVVAAAPDAYGLSSERALLLATVLLRNSRDASDLVAFEKWAAVVEKFAASDANAAAELVYQRCLLTRDALDFRKLESLLGGLVAPDPVWKLRKASLHCDLRQWDRAESLLVEALDEWRQRQSDARSSLWIRSRRTWAQWLTFAAQRFEAIMRAEETSTPDFSKESESKCDPWKEIDVLARDVLDAQEKIRQEDLAAFVPQFEAGSYRDSERTPPMDRDTSEAEYALRRLSERVGLPVEIDHVRMFPSAPYALALQPQMSVRWFARLLRAIQSEKHPLIDQYLARVAVAAMPKQVARDFGKALFSAVTFWQGRCRSDIGDAKRRSDSVEALRMHLTALSRLTPRMDEARAINCFQLGVELSRDAATVHIWLIEPLSQLLRYSLQAVTPDTRSALFIDALDFPLAQEAGATGHEARWPNPVSDYFELSSSLRRPEGDHRWAKRIHELLAAASNGKSSRPEAILRLALLSKRSLLESGESSEFEKVLWSEGPGLPVGLPTGTALLPHVFVGFPAPAGIDALTRARDHLVSDLESLPTNLKKLEAIAHGASVFKPLFADAAAASKVVEHLLDHSRLDGYKEVFMRASRSELRAAIARVVALAVVPAMPPGSISEALANRIIELSEESDMATLVFALPHFQVFGSALTDRAIERIRSGLAGLTWGETDASASAIVIWHDMHTSGGGSEVPTRLVEGLLNSLDARRDVGLLQALHAARRLCAAGFTSHDFPARVARAVVHITKASNYAGVDAIGRRAVSISKVRRECVLLADFLLPVAAAGLAVELRNWLESAKDDPLPEVRFALLDEAV